MNINENKLELKYFLGNYKLLSEYPTNNDILFYIIDYLNKNDKDSITLNSLLKEFKDIDINNQIEYLINENYLRYSKNQKNLELIKNPYIYE